MILKRQCLCLIMMFLMVASSGLVAHAGEFESQPNATGETVCAPRKEETEWAFRKNPVTGELEKRLWSNTYGKWLTEWEPL